MGVSSSPTHHSTHSHLQPASTTWMNLLKLSWTSFVLNPWNTFDSSSLLKSAQYLTKLTISLKYSFHKNLCSWFLYFLTTGMNTGFNQGFVSNHSLLFLLYSSHLVNLTQPPNIIIIYITFTNNPKINTFISNSFLVLEQQQQQQHNI